MHNVRLYTEYGLLAVSLFTRRFPSYPSSSLFHRARTVQVGMQDLLNFQGSMANRGRALRLAHRVAKLIDTLDRLPSQKEVIDYCTQCTTGGCKCTDYLQLII